MTAIVGIAEKGRVWIGGDSAGVAGYALSTRADEKVFTNGVFVFGFTTSFRMGQLLRHSFTPPTHDDRVNASKFMVTTFIDAVRACLKAGGFAKLENDREEGGTFLVGYAGHLYEIDSDYQVGEPIDTFAAVGCGHQIAMGAMHGTPKTWAPELRIRTALEAAERYSAGVRGPFNIVSTKAAKR